MTARRHKRVSLQDRNRLIEAHENDEDFVATANLLGIVVFTVLICTVYIITVCTFRSTLILHIF